MPVVLRKRKAPAPPPAPPPKKQTKVAKAAPKAKEVVKETAKRATSTANGAASKKAAPVAAPSVGKLAVGDVVSLEGFGGEIETNDGAKITLKALVDESKAGVVLFTYPKASTPGCTKQVCLFRDSYAPLTANGLAIYGLSTDSPKANTTFKEKQKLPYTLLCDPSATLIGAIGLKKAPKGTTRGVFVIDKSGKVLAAEPGGPDATVNVVTKLVEELGAGATDSAAPPADEEKPAAEAETDVAAAADDEIEKKEDKNSAAADEEKTESVNGEAEKEETEEKEEKEEKE